MKILFVASECAPFAKTGGLGDVVGALPKALHALGIDVRVVLPLYAGIDWNALDRLEGTLGVPMWFGTAWCGVRMGRLPGSDVPIYFLEHNHFFDRPDAALRAKDQLRLRILCLRVVAPGAGKRAALEKDGRAQSWAVLTGHALDVEVTNHCHINTGCDFPLR